MCIQQSQRKLRNLIGKGHLSKSMNAGGQVLQVRLVNVKLIRHREKKRLLCVLFEQLQMLLRTRFPPETEDFEQHRFIAFDVPKSKVGDPESFPERIDFGLFFDLPIGLFFFKQLDEHLQLRRDISAQVGSV
mgnify:CR=1 FL=1